jgi:protein-S-isoprenylcysteine O-methyltransferase Ste14
METETIFRIILPALIIAFAAHRGYYVRKHGEEQNTLKRQEEGLPSRVASLLGLSGFIAVIVYVINPDWLSWASLSLPLWLRWTGTGIVLLGFALLQWSQNTLGMNWSDTPRMIEEQSLITSGPYQFIRHPIYTAFVLILGSTLLISANWFIGFAWIGMTVLEVASRVSFEENLMLEYFGEHYREYMKRTGDWKIISKSNSIDFMSLRGRCFPVGARSNLTINQEIASPFGLAMTVTTKETNNERKYLSHGSCPYPFHGSGHLILLPPQGRSRQRRKNLP